MHNSVHTWSIFLRPLNSLILGDFLPSQIQIVSPFMNKVCKKNVKQNSNVWNWCLLSKDKCRIRKRLYCQNWHFILPTSEWFLMFYFSGISYVSYCSLTVVQSVIPSVLHINTRTYNKVRRSGKISKVAILFYYFQSA